MRCNKILFVTTSTNKISSTTSGTGVWLEALATPYYLFKEAGTQVSIASPNGGKIPLDPKGLSIIAATRNSKRFLKDSEAIHFITNALPLHAINPNEFDALFLPGGQGCLWDFAENTSLKLLLEEFIELNKPIALLGQASVSLLNLQHSTGSLSIKGRHITASSNSEETSTGTSALLPLMIENECVTAGAVYSKTEDFRSHAVVDGNIITGQNPASAEAVANKLLTAMEDNKYFAMVTREQSFKKSSSL